MKLRKRIVFGGLVLLSLAALVLAVVAMFFKSSFYDEAWIVTIFGGLFWVITAFFVNAECEGDTPDEIAAARVSERRHMISSAIALAIAVALLFVGLITRSVWSYVEDEGFKVDKLVVGEIDATELNVTEANITKANVTEVHATEVHATKAYATEVHATKAYATEVHATEVRATKVYATEVHATKVQATEVHADKGIFGIIIGTKEPTTQKPTTKPAPKPTEPTTQKPTETPTQKPTAKPTEPTTQTPSLTIYSINRDAYGDPVMRTANDTVTLKLVNCNISDIDYYWVNAETGEKQTAGISFAKISEGQYELVVEDWVFNSAEDIQIKNPATRNQYYTVTIEPVY